MKPTEMKRLLADNKIQLTKSLGQNFLFDNNQLQRIVRSADLGPADQVLEIGPGLGPLTQLLLVKSPKVLAIEMDRRLYEVLRQRFKHVPGLTLIHADALEYLRACPNDWSDWKLVANLPYSVASPILVELAKMAQCPRRIVVTLQREVVQRLLAEPGNRNYGILTLLIQLRYTPEGSFKIPASCFFPPPAVDSACLSLVRRSGDLLAPEHFPVFEKLVKRSFSQRRKIAMNLIKKDRPAAAVTDAFERLNLNPKARAEHISLDQFVGLAQLLAS